MTMLDRIESWVTNNDPWADGQKIQVSVYRLSKLLELLVEKELITEDEAVAIFY